ncbi:hypothetical protein J4466_01330 [Candidatus Pacearchaeota archaeon]|nr:hypothetical protein [Candidatus Pacearchaeota archaeon]
MVKKKAASSASSGLSSSNKAKKLSQTEINQQLIDNFVALQRVMTNLSVKFDSLSDQISKLLNLFEISAKSFAEKNAGKITKEDKEFLDKLDKLLDQNKLIAKGLTMMEERAREKMNPQSQVPVQRPAFQPEQGQNPQTRPRQLPRF